jgi:hypothetical protein
MRSKLKTRGAHAAKVSFMIVSPKFFVDPIRIASRPWGKGYRHKEIGAVSQCSAGIMLLAKCLSRRLSISQLRQRR